MFDTVLVDSKTFSAVQFMSAQPKEEFTTEKPEPGVRRPQKQNKEGVPVWKVQVTAVNWRGRADTLQVSVAMHESPADKFEPMQPIEFSNLMFGAMRQRDSGKTSLWWSADGIAAAGGTSSAGTSSGQ